MKLPVVLNVLVTTLVVVSAACKNGVRMQGASASGSGGSSNVSPACHLASPPPPGPAQAPDGTISKTFAITKLYLGDTDPDGTPDPTNGWRHWGYNIDGICAGSASTAPFCKLVAGADAGVRVEGDQGIENSFGHDIIVPILDGSNPSGAINANGTLALGGWTVLITIDSLGNGPAYEPLSATIRAGAQLGSPPKLDGSDEWPFESGSIVSLPQSYLVGNTWVSGPPTTGGIVSILLDVDGVGLKVHIDHVIVSMNFDGAHEHATAGVISGVINPADLMTELAGSIVASCIECYSCASVSAQLQWVGQASDIMQDATQEPTKTCDGISIGLGFDAEPVLLGASVPAPPPPNPCAVDGGP